MSREVIWVRASPEREREARAWLVERRVESPEETEEQWRMYCAMSGIAYEAPRASEPPRSEEEQLWAEWSAWL